MAASRRILIVDDDPHVRTALSEALAEEGYGVTVADGGAQALALFEQAAPDVVLSDVRMDDVGGLALLELLRTRASDVDVILMTAFDDMPTVVAAMRGGAVEFLTKPIRLDHLRTVIARVFDDRRLRRRAERDPDEPAAQVGDIVGRDPTMIEVYKLIGQAARTRATVLIRGESGTGKELVARAIHANSDAAREPFVPVNCAALPNTLLESELFGHVRGAFTGAHESRRGRFALAGRGSIFLDEIGDTSLEFQTRLLRVVQDREFQPVGSEQTEKTAARVLAATHQDLEQMIADHHFREDLYYRLRVVEIRIPPLRERRGDIPLIARQTVKRAAASVGLEGIVLSDDALDLLIAHPWPGNVRELENCLTRAVVIASGNVIRPEHLSMSSRPGASSASLSSLEQMEREHLTRVLAATDGQKMRAAEILGVSRPRLNRLLEKYGLE